MYTNQCMANDALIINLLFLHLVTLLYPISIPFSFHVSILCIIDLAQIIAANVLNKLGEKLRRQIMPWFNIPEKISP